MSGVLSILNCIYHGVTMIFLADSNPTLIWDKIEEEKILRCLHSQLFIAICLMN